MENISKLLFLGLPESGKTTFLAAFWYFIRNNESPKGLISHELPAERQYLNNICDTWMKGEKQAHTGGGRILDVELKLLDKATGRRSVLYIPDISGELFTMHWAGRAWSKLFHDLASSANCVLLFIHPNAISSPLSVSDVKSGEWILDSRDGGATSNSGPPEEAECDLATDFETILAPPQVILVDQLQCLLGSPCFLPHIKLSVIVSAWDEVQAEKLDPRLWLSKHAPLLDQFIRSNKERLTTRVFGVSAQGGDLETEATRAQLLLYPNAADRIRVIDDDGKACDIAETVRWVI